MTETLEQMVARHEGFVPTVYCDRCGNALIGLNLGFIVWRCARDCPGGNLTVGCGTRISGAGITQADGWTLMRSRLQRDAAEMMTSHIYLSLDNVRREALLDMAYTLGVGGVFGFTKMWQALQDLNWPGASSEILNSKWAKQAPARAREIAQILLTGEMPDR